MKILMTSSGGIIRGIESWPEYGLAKGLAKKGHDITVISSSSVLQKHDAKRDETVEGIKVRRFSPMLPSSLHYMLKNSFDLLHMHHLGYLAPISSYGAMGKKIRRIPSVFTVHGLYHDPHIVQDVDDPFSAETKKLQLSFPFAPWKIPDWLCHLPFSADRITALTKWEKKELEKKGLASKKITVVPNGVSLEKYKKKRKDFFKKAGIDGRVLLFTGQPTNRKGWRYLLEAMPAILEEFPDAKAVFTGYRQSPEINEMTRKAGLNDAVKMLGFLKEEEKIHAFQSADVFVLPTLYEGFGIVFLEAMAAGVPIVTTDTAGNSEIVENWKNGILTRPKSSKGVAEAVIKLLSTSGMRKEIARNNIRKAARFGWKKVTEMYISVYEDAIK